MILGMSKAEIKKNFDKIVDFSGLGKFIDAPFYTYSSGMKLRLGFSIATHSSPDILLIDEILAVGDREFQRKSYKAIQGFFRQGKTIIFISHHLESINNLCPKSFLLKSGKIKFIGKTKEAISLYLNSL